MLESLVVFIKQELIYSAGWPDRSEKKKSTYSAFGAWFEQHYFECIVKQGYLLFVNFSFATKSVVKEMSEKSSKRNI